MRRMRASRCEPGSGAVKNGNSAAAIMIGVVVVRAAIAAAMTMGDGR